MCKATVARIATKRTFSGVTAPLLARPDRRTTPATTGMLSNRWAVDDSYPINYIPRGVRLTAYAGSADDLPAPVLQAWLDRLAAGRLAIGPLRAYTLGYIPSAHAELEHNRVFGKLVGVIDPADPTGTPSNR